MFKIITECLQNASILPKKPRIERKIAKSRAEWSKNQEYIPFSPRPTAATKHPDAITEELLSELSAISKGFQELAGMQPAVPNIIEYTYVSPMTNLEVAISSLQDASTQSSFTLQHLLILDHIVEMLEEIAEEIG